MVRKPELWLKCIKLHVKGATGIPYLEAKRQQWIKRDVNEMSFGIHKRKKRAKSGK